MQFYIKHILIDLTYLRGRQMYYNLFALSITCKDVFWPAWIIPDIRYIVILQT